MNRLTALIAFATTAAVTTSLEAQGRDRGGRDIPPGHYPPAGMCRIWIDGVPPGQQSAPMKCEDARREVPSNGRVILGDDDPRRNRRDEDDKRGREDRDRNDDRYDRDRDNDADRRAERRDRERRPRREIRLGERVDCDDRNRDDFCDAFLLRTKVPSEMPRMESAMAYRRGQITSDVRQWLGSRSLRADFTEVRNEGELKIVTWRDTNGGIVQRWFNTDGDSRADRIEIFRGNRVVIVIGDKK